MAGLGFKLSRPGSCRVSATPSGLAAFPSEAVKNIEHSSSTIAFILIALRDFTHFPLAIPLEATTLYDVPEVLLAKGGGLIIPTLQMGKQSQR